MAPLAGISLLTAAAAVALNPVLVSISITGKKRRKRSLLGQDLPPSNSSKLDPEVKDKIHEMEVKMGTTISCNTPKGFEHTKSIIEQ